MATYTKRSSGLWQAKVRKKGYPTQSKTFSNKAMAQKWATEVEAQMNGRIFRSYKSAEQSTFKEVCERYKDEVVPLKKSSQQLTSMINNLIAKFGNHTIATITPESLVQYRNERLKSVSDQTVRKDLMCIRRILAVASKEWGIYLPSGNPVDMITVPPQARQGRDRRLESDEEDRLLRSAEDYGGEIESIILFAIETAMRRSEIHSLMWDHVNLHQSTASLVDTKNGEDRTIPLSPKALNIIHSLDKNKNRRVFSMRPDSITQAFERICKRANIQNLRFHDLRHEATSRLFEKGLNIMEVSLITGHKDLSMLKRYTHLRAESLVHKLS